MGKIKCDKVCINPLADNSETLPKQIWLQAAENIGVIASLISDILKDINADGLGEKDAKDFENDMLLAVIAMRYVAEYATDKCKFVLISGEEEGGQA